MNKPSSSHIYFVALFLFALSLRLLLFLFIFNHPERILDVDSPLYLRLGEGMLDSLEFRDIFRTPVYPAFIASVYALFGKFPHMIAAAQSVVDAITAVLTALIFLRISGNTRFAYVAGILYALNPFAVYYSEMILSETLFTFLLAAALYCFILFSQSHSRKCLIASSLLLGVGALCRPIGVYTPLLLAPFLFISGVSLKRRVADVLIFLMVFSLTILPYQMRNYYHYGYWGLSTVGDFNLVFYEAPSVLMIRENPLSIFQARLNEPFYRHQKAIWDEARKKYGWNENSCLELYDNAQKLQMLKNDGTAILKKNIPAVMLSHIAGTGRTLFPFSPNFGKLLGGNVLMINVLSFLVDLCIMGLSIFGVVSAFRRNPATLIHRVTAICMAGLIVYFAFMPGVMSYARFRVPVIPYISIFASLGLSQLLMRRV